MKYYNTEFYKLLKKAINNDDDLENVIHLIKPMLIKHSFINKKFDEDLYSILKLHAVKIIRQEIFLQKISKKF